MSITTKQGDDGYTSLLNGKRVHKFDLRLELMGTMDELSSYLGFVKNESNDSQMKIEIQNIQENISTIMAQIAYGNSGKYNVSRENLKEIENLTAKYESMYPGLKGFIIPGNTRLSSLMDIARTVARRMERQLISVDRFYPVHENCKIYMNRVSDYIYTIARFTDFKEEIKSRVKDILEKETAGINNKTLNLNSAKAILEEVEKKAEGMNLPVALAVANEWGNTIALHFMDGALPASCSIAADKAYTSAAVRLTTEEIGKLAQNGQPLYGIGNTNNNRIVTFGGGYPLKINDRVVGGIGVSGGSAEQDIELAAYGAEVFKKI